MNKLTQEQSVWLQSATLQKLFDGIEAAGGEVRVNGGAVRNALMNVKVNDVDLSTTLVPGDTVKALESIGFKTIPTGIEHGTITAILEGDSYEVTTLREDIETDGRYATVKFGTNWIMDAQRRDLTINAIYCDRVGALFDPLGGIEDVEKRNVRFIGLAEDRIKEDYLRILRFFRFFAWYGEFRPDAAGLKASAKLKAGLEDISAERIWIELKKILSAKDPSRALLWMRTTGVLNLILPESEKWGIDLIGPMVAAEPRQRIAVDPMLRLMAIIPPRCEIVEAISKRLKLSRDETARLNHWANTAKIDQDTKPAELEKIFYQNDLQAVKDVIHLEIILYDSKAPNASKALKNQIGFLKAAKKYERPIFPVKGEDLLKKGIEAGPQMGEALRELEGKWVESGFKLSKADLLKLS